MQFEGLKGLLKKKATEQRKQPQPPSSAASPATAPSPHRTNGETFVAQPEKGEDPYALAVRTVLASRQPASPQADAPMDSSQLASPPSTTTTTPSTTAHSDARRGVEGEEGDGEEEVGVVVGSKRPRPASPTTATAAGKEDDTAASASPSPPSSVPLLSQKAMEEDRQGALRALDDAMRAVAGRPPASGTMSTASEKPASSLPLTGSPPSSSSPSSKARSQQQQSVKLCVPVSVQRFAVATYVDGDGRFSGASATATPEETIEAALLHDLAAELSQNTTNADKEKEEVEGPSSSSSCSRATPLPSESALSELAGLLNTLWFLVAAQWRHAIAGEPSEAYTVTGSSNGCTRLQGWCYPVYLLSRHAMPDEMKLTMGRQAALLLDRWRAVQRTRRAALELLAYLLADYQTLLKESSTSADSTAQGGDRTHATQARSVKEAAAKSSDVSAARIVPRELCDGLVRMVVQHAQQQHDFAAARQDYADLTLGTANWKLGLFSGGEVHMRRSMEKVERNRIAHLLNNEHAVHLLHALRELVHFAERGLSPTESRLFFSLAVAPPASPGVVPKTL